MRLPALPLRVVAIGYVTPLAASWAIHPGPGFIGVSGSVYMALQNTGLPVSLLSLLASVRILRLASNLAKATSAGAMTGIVAAVVV